MADLGAFVVEPRGAKDISVLFDPAHDLDFKGGLSVAVTGYGPDEIAVLRIQVELEIADPVEAVDRPRSDGETGPVARRTMRHMSRKVE